MSRTKSWRGTRIYTPAILHRGAMRLIGLVSQVQLDAGLRERHMGIFQGLTLAEMRERFPKERAEFERRWSVLSGLCDSGLTPGGHRADRGRDGAPGLRPPAHALRRVRLARDVLH